MRPFHLAFAVNDLEATRAFYVNKLGASLGRESENEWIDFDLYGNQISAHFRSGFSATDTTGAVDGDAVPVPHFGAIVTLEEFDLISKRLQSDPNTNWVIEPRTRFKGEAGEQSTLFVRDPSGNALEFKAFKEDASIFAK